MRAHHAFALLVNMPLAVGCYAYRPVEAPLPARASLELSLSEHGTLAVAPTIGPNVAQLLGVLVSSTDDSLAVSISEVHTSDAQTFFLRGTTVSVARSDLSLIRHRQLDRRRSIVATAVAIFGAGALITAVRFAGGGQDAPGGGGVTPP